MNKLIRYIFFIIALLYNTPAYSLDVISHTPKAPNSALIMLHGWGGSGKRMTWLTNKLQDKFSDMAFYYPTAQNKAPHDGYEWFVIPSLGGNMSQNEIYKKMMSSALLSLKELHNLIEEIHQTQDIEYENIHIAGFSQGGLMALLTSLTSYNPIGKTISFSGVPLLFTEDFTPKDIKSIPDILIIQGDNDHIIPADSYNLTNKTLKSINITPNLKIIKNMPHTINNKALSHAIEFLKNK